MFLKTKHFSVYTIFILFDIFVFVCVVVVQNRWEKALPETKKNIEWSKDDRERVHGLFERVLRSTKNKTKRAELLKYMVAKIDERLKQIAEKKWQNYPSSEGEVYVAQTYLKCLHTVLQYLDKWKHGPTLTAEDLQASKAAQHFLSCYPVFKVFSNDKIKPSFEPTVFGIAKFASKALGLQDHRENDNPNTQDTVNKLIPKEKHPQLLHMLLIHLMEIVKATPTNSSAGYISKWVDILTDFTSKWPEHKKDNPKLEPVLLKCWTTVVKHSPTVVPVCYDNICTILDIANKHEISNHTDILENTAELIRHLAEARTISSKYDIKQYCLPVDQANEILAFCLNTIMKYDFHFFFNNFTTYTNILLYVHF